MTTCVERSFRGISKRLAARYLQNLGGEQVSEGAVEGEGWQAHLSADTVEIGPTLTLTEVTVVFEGDEAVLETLVEDFARKAMRAGG
ncbi:hypothetical protein ACYJ1Y_11975 [Natrialbaceae archaeon A-gly3]